MPCRGPVETVISWRSGIGEATTLTLVEQTAAGSALLRRRRASGRRSAPGLLVRHDDALHLAAQVERHLRHLGDVVPREHLVLGGEPIRGSATDRTRD